MSWAKNSVTLITMSFVILVLFIALSSPISQIFGLIDSEAVKLGVDGDVSPLIESFRMTFGLCFCLAMVSIGVWFFLGSHDEPSEERHQRWE